MGELLRSIAVWTTPQVVARKVPERKERIQLSPKLPLVVSSVGQDGRHMLGLDDLLFRDFQHPMIVRDTLIQVQLGASRILPISRARARQNSIGIHVTPRAGSIITSGAFFDQRWSQSGRAG